VQAGMRGPLYAAEDLAVSEDLGFQVIPAGELRVLGPEQFAAAAMESIGRRPVFLSFDDDFLDPAYAPDTGTPEVRGFSTTEAQGFLRALRGITLAGADVVESSPLLPGLARRPPSQRPTSPWNSWRFGLPAGRRAAPTKRFAARSRHPGPSVSERFCAPG
jgi:Arginase family